MPVQGTEDGRGILAGVGVVVRGLWHEKTALACWREEMTRCSWRSFLSHYVVLFLLTMALPFAIFSAEVHAKSVAGTIGKSISKKLSAKTIQKAGKTVERTIPARVIKQLPPDIVNSFAGGRYAVSGKVKLTHPGN